MTRALALPLLATTAACAAALVGCEGIIGITDLVLVDGGESRRDAAKGTDGGSEPKPEPEPEPDCTSVCALIQGACKKYPSCKCMFEGAVCVDRLCTVQNEKISATCGDVTCTGIEGGKIACRTASGPNCACN